MSMLPSDLIALSVAASLHGLCEAYGIEGVVSEPARSSELPDGLEERVGLIAFRGTGVNGTVALSLPPPLARAMWPGAPPESRESLEDWTAELTNQLMGRLKNRLLSAGVALAVTSPAVIPGSLATVQAAAINGSWRRFHTGQGWTVVVGVGMGGGDRAGSSLPPPDTNATSALEGELILF